jgi:hypothetical protein
MGLAARQKSPSKLTSQPRNRGKDAVLFLKIMQGKYGRNMIHTNKAIAKATDSNLWKSLVSFWEQIENLSVWAVGIGRTVSAWDHCWIAPNIKIADLDITISDNLVRAKVRELITDSRDWNWQLLEDWLPVNILRKILAIHPPDDTNGEDARLWPEGKWGAFTASSAYHLLCDYSTSPLDGIWNKIWKLKVTERSSLYLGDAS